MKIEPPFYEGICEPINGITDRTAIICKPINGQWSEWSKPSNDLCNFDQETKKWTKLRERNCSNPEPQFGGICKEKNGIGKFENTTCKPIHGGWSEWSYLRNGSCRENGSYN